MLKKLAPIFMLTLVACSDSDSRAFNEAMTNMNREMSQSGGFGSTNSSYGTYGAPRYYGNGVGNTNRAPVRSSSAIQRAPVTDYSSSGSSSTTSSGSTNSSSGSGFHLTSCKSGTLRSGIEEQRWSTCGKNAPSEADAKRAAQARLDQAVSARNAQKAKDAAALRVLEAERAAAKAEFNNRPINTCVGCTIPQ
ncbi:hypothetical protein GGQ68_004250 [Sagittula marina]|uniref:Lipoprotein n=1 Tax=Sagittula marina TaxID=943940 RepID=A0A7W6DUB1_9RHOB|nr:hypothetical protein [Sagittula marina]